MSCQKYRNAFWVFQMKIESYGNRELMHMGKLELHTGEVHIWKLRWRELETFWEWHKPLLEKEEYQKVKHYHFYEDQMAIMKKAYQKLLQRNDIATEIQEFEEITRKSTEHWNIISFNSDDAEVGQILVKLEISNTSAYKMTGIVAALLAIRSAQTKRKSGIWNAYETIQMQYVFEKLQEEGVFIKETQEVSAVYEESEETGIL